VESENKILDEDEKVVFRNKAIIMLLAVYVEALILYFLNLKVGILLGMSAIGLTAVLVSTAAIKKGLFNTKKNHLLDR